MTLTFRPELQLRNTQCANISITDDEVLEALESFTVVIESTDPDVIATPGRDQASVFITDDDSQCSDLSASPSSVNC